MQFNKIDIKSTEDEEEPSPVPGIGIMVLVDGEVYASSDYHVLGGPGTLDQIFS